MTAAKPSDKDLRALFKEAKRRGWTVSGGGERHFKLTKPGHNQVIVSSSGSDVRNVRHQLAQLRREDKQ